MNQTQNMTQDGYGHAYQQGFIRTVRLLRSRGASTDNANDVAQTAWLRGWQKLDQLRDERMIVSWVNTIALNYHRSGTQDDARHYEPLPETCGTTGIDLAAIDAATVLALCGPRDRALLQQQMAGLTTGEMARKQGVTATTIRIQLFRARRAVRARIEGRAKQRREGRAAPPLPVPRGVST